MPCLSELEPGAELNLERIPGARDEPDGLLEQRTPSVSLIVLSEVRAIEYVEELGEDSQPPGLLTDGEELRHAGVEKRKWIAPFGVHRHLPAARWVPVAIGENSVSVRLETRQQVTR